MGEINSSSRLSRHTYQCHTKWISTFESQCKNIVRHGDYAEIEFENGVKVEADLVIGADGIRSLTRNLFFQSRLTCFPHYHAYRALVNVDETYGLATGDTLRIVANDKVNLYLLPLKYRKQVSVDITVPHQDRTGRPKVPKEDMLKELKNFHPDFKRLLENLIIGMFAHYMISIQFNSGAMNALLY